LRLIVVLEYRPQPARLLLATSAARSGAFACEAGPDAYYPVHKANDPDNVDAVAGSSIYMSPHAKPELITVLARAFDAAWSDYYEKRRNGLLPEETARPMLANFLVARAKEGGCDEAAMAAAGLAYLMSLTPVELNDVSLRLTPGVWKLDCKGATARFTNLWRVRITRYGI
jgi:hypothetical protein